MPKFATGKNAYFISDRSGFRYKYKDMRKEWNGSIVGKDEYEPKHEQLGPFTQITEGIALRDARPDRNEPMSIFVGVRTVEQPNPNNMRMLGKIGTVTVAIS